MKTTIAAFLVLAGLSFAGGCSSSGGATNEVHTFGATKSAAAAPVAETAATPTKMAMANSKCPMKGTAVNPEMSAEWNGQKVGFCCPGCKSNWAKLSDSEKQSKLAAAK
ncbi:MAG: hypothetical protein ACREJO_05095 [Phycisphaerales bacterium]